MCHNDRITEWRCAEWECSLKNEVSVSFLVRMTTKICLKKKEKQKTIGKKYKEKPCFLEYLSNMNQIYHPPLNNYGTRHNIWNNVLQTMDFRKNGILVPVTNEIMRWVLSLSQFTAWRHFLCHSSERRILKESSHIAEKRRQRTEFRDFTAAITCRTQ